MLRRSLLLIAALSAPALSSADILYAVTPDPDEGTLHVEMSFAAEPGVLELQMPNWSPGAYMLRDMGANVADLQVTSSDGYEFRFTHEEGNSWKVNIARNERLTVSYSVPSQISAGAMHFSGPSTYLYVVGRKEEDCRLKLKPPIGWKIAIGLDPIGESYFDYSASDYDVLADNPVTMGDFVELRYFSHGVPHTIAMRGEPRKDVDYDEIIRVCKKITDGQGDFFGGLPFSKYIWHFSVNPNQDGGGGLEHLTSTQISLPKGIGPRSKRVLAHEYFHLWNVKRIRSSVLGPFDYTVLPKTGALYWLEGVTDYYASLLCTRDGVLSMDALLGDLVSNTTAVRNNGSQMEVSPYEASYRVDETNNGRGNSNGYKLSYYNYGWVTGLCLDLELRDRTDNKRSLDDVMRALWEICKDDKPGFREEEIRAQYVRFGGSGGYFDSIVMQAGALPIEEQLAKIGYELSSSQVGYTDNGFEITPDFTASTIGIRSVREHAESAGLKVNDVLVEIDGVVIQGDTMGQTFQNYSSAVAKAAIGKVMKIKVRRGEKEVDLTLVPIESFRSVWKVNEIEGASDKARAMRKAWSSK